MPGDSFHSAFFLFGTHPPRFCPLDSKRAKRPPNGGLNMQTITPENTEFQNEKKSISHDQLEREILYVRAKQILELTLEGGLISLSEFNEITMLNRQSFSPALASIMSDKR